MTNSGGGEPLVEVRLLCYIDSTTSISLNVVLPVTRPVTEEAEDYWNRHLYTFTLIMIIHNKIKLIANRSVGIFTSKPDK